MVSNMSTLPFVETFLHSISWTLLHSELKLPRLGFVHPFRDGRCRTRKQQSLIQGTSRSTKETWQGRHAKHRCVFGASSFFGNLHNHNSNSLRKLQVSTSANEILDLICPADSMGSHLVSCQDMPREFEADSDVGYVFPVHPLSSANFSNLLWWVQSASTD